MVVEAAKEIQIIPPATIAPVFASVWSGWGTSILVLLSLRPFIKHLVGVGSPFPKFTPFGMQKYMADG